MRQPSGRLYTLVAPEQRGAMTQFFTGLHALLRPAFRRWREGQPHLAFEFDGCDGKARLQLFIPTGEEAFVSDLLRAAMPGAELRPEEIDPLAFEPQGSAAFADIGLVHSHYLPLQVSGDVDPLAPLLSVLSRPRGVERIHLSLLVRPRPSGWQTHARSYARRLRNGSSSYVAEALLPTPAQKRSATPHELERAKAAEGKGGASGFDCALRLVTVANDEIAAREYLRAVAGSLRSFDGANSFVFRRVWRPKRFAAELRARSFPATGSFILTPEELAEVFHTPEVAPPHVEAIRSPLLPVPADVPSVGTVLGVSNYAGSARPVAQRITDAFQHTHITGKTGTGKSVLLSNITLQHIEAGRAVVAIDMKGDLVENVLARIPKHRERDVVVIAPSERDVSVTLNPLAWADRDERFLIADNVVGVIRRIAGEQFWGPRSQELIHSGLLTLLTRPDATLCELPAIFSDEALRARHTQSRNYLPGLAAFWSWFDSLSDAQRVEVLSAPLNKTRSLLIRPAVRRMICSRSSSIDLQRIIDGRGIVLVKLPVGVLSEPTAVLIGSLILSALWNVVRRRAAVPESERTETVLVADEWQLLLGIAQPFSEILSTARSYKLALVLANQHLSQLPRELRESLAGNIGTRIVLPIGLDDAKYLAREFAPLDAEALVNLPRYSMAVRLAVDGAASRPFTARALPLPPTSDPQTAERVIALSRARWTRPVAQIDAEADGSPRARKLEPPSYGVGRRPLS